MITATGIVDRTAIDPDTLAVLARMGLTPRQAEVFAYVFEHTRLNGYQPSVRDLMDRFGVTGTNAIVGHLKALERKGWVGRSDGDSRALRLLKGPDGERFEGFRYITGGEPAP